MKRVESLSEAINILITATQIGYSKNCFNMQESWQIQEAINFFQDLAKQFPVETEQEPTTSKSVVETASTLKHSEK